MSAGSPRGGKANIQIVNETTDKAHFYLSSDFNLTHAKKITCLMIFKRVGLLSKLQHLNVHLTSHWILYQTNTTSKKNWANTSSLIFLNLQCSANTATSKAFSSLTLIFKKITRGVNQSVLIQRAFIMIHFCITLQCPASVATLTCHPPASLMLLTNFILFPNPQMLFLSHSIWPLGFCALCTAGSGPRSIQPRTVWQKQHKALPRNSKATATETWLPLLCYQTPPRKICHWTDVFPSKGDF